MPAGGGVPPAVRNLAGGSRPGGLVGKAGGRPRDGAGRARAQRPAQERPPLYRLGLCSPGLYGPGLSRPGLARVRIVGHHVLRGSVMTAIGASTSSA
jgi:hypothetical protein